MFSVNIALNSGLQRGISTNKITLLILVCISHSSLASLQMSSLLKRHITTTNLTTVLTLAHYSKLSLLCPPPPPPSSTLTADDFAIFSTNKTSAISDQFLSPQTDDNQRRKFPNLFFPIIPLLVHLFALTHFLQDISSSVIPALTHIINTSLHTGNISHSI